jgi:hypothetical protein
MKQYVCAIGTLCLGTATLFAQAHGGAMPTRVPPPKPVRAEKTKSPRPEHPLDRWAAMPPREREAALAKLPPAKRENLEQRIARWETMTPAQKERARNFAAMPADQKLIVKQHAEWMQQIPQDRRAAVRKEINSLQQLSPEARAAEMEAPSFARRFDTVEREHIGKMVSIMPPE